MLYLNLELKNIRFDVVYYNDKFIYALFEIKNLLMNLSLKNFFNYLNLLKKIKKKNFNLNMLNKIK